MKKTQRTPKDPPPPPPPLPTPLPPQSEETPLSSAPAKSNFALQLTNFLGKARLPTLTQTSLRQKARSHDQLLSSQRKERANRPGDADESDPLHASLDSRLADESNPTHSSASDILKLHSSSLPTVVSGLSLEQVASETRNRTGDGQKWTDATSRSLATLTETTDYKERRRGVGYGSIPVLNGDDHSIASSANTSVTSTAIPFTSDPIESHEKRYFQKKEPVDTNMDSQPNDDPPVPSLNTNPTSFKEGYVNKRSDFQALGRSWKMYRCVLRGSKLQFFKPPPENAIKPSKSQESQLARQNLPNPADRGVPLQPDSFESSARPIVFDSATTVASGGRVLYLPPLASRYVFGDIATQSVNHRRKHCCLLIFDDSVLIFRRKWTRSGGQGGDFFRAMGGAMKFKSSESLQTEPENSIASILTKAPSETSLSGASLDHVSTSPQSPLSPTIPAAGGRPSKGHWTKWKHEATYALSKVEAFDIPLHIVRGSDIPQSHSTSSIVSTGEPSAEPNLASVYMALQVTDANNSEKLLFRWRSVEARSTWMHRLTVAKASRLQKIMGDHAATSRPVTVFVGPDFFADEDSVRQGALDVSSPNSNRNVGKTRGRENRSEKERRRVFWGTDVHPELTVAAAVSKQGEPPPPCDSSSSSSSSTSLHDANPLRTSPSRATTVSTSTAVTAQPTSRQRLILGGTVDSLIHELVFQTVEKSDRDDSCPSCEPDEYLDAFLLTYRCFTTAKAVLEELERCAMLGTRAEDPLDREITDEDEAPPIDGQTPQTDGTQSITTDASKPECPTRKAAQVGSRVIDIFDAWTTRYAADISQDMAASMLKIVTDVLIPADIPGAEKCKCELEGFVVQKSIVKAVEEDLNERDEENEITASPSPEALEPTKSTGRKLSGPVDLSNVSVTGLTTAVFLRIPAKDFAEQIYVYHYTHAETYAFLEPLEVLPAIAQTSRGASNPCTNNPFIHNSPSSPHFLASLIYHHLLSASPAGQTARRSALLTHWIMVARECVELGDIAAWTAIVMAIASPPIVRLEETWRGVDRVCVGLLKEVWVPEMMKWQLYEATVNPFPLDPTSSASAVLALFPTEVMRSIEKPSSRVSEDVQMTTTISTDGPITPENLISSPNPIPYIGAVRHAIDRLLRIVPTEMEAVGGSFGGSPQAVYFAKFWRVSDMVSSVVSSYRETTSELVSKPCPFVREPHLQKYFLSLSSSLNSCTAIDENKLHLLSLSCEPHFSEGYLEHHHRLKPVKTGGHVGGDAGLSYLPLVFVDPLPVPRYFLPKLPETRSILNRKGSNPLISFGSNATGIATLAGSGNSGTSIGSPNLTKSVGSSRKTSNVTDPPQPTLAVSGDTPESSNASSPTSPEKPRCQRRQSFPPSRMTVHLNAKSHEVSHQARLGWWSQTHSRSSPSGKAPFQRGVVGTSYFEPVAVSSSDLSANGWDLYSKDGELHLRAITGMGVATVSRTVSAFDVDSSTNNECVPPVTQRTSRGSLNSIFGEEGAEALVVVVKSGTIEKLVDVLVSGVAEFSARVVDDNGEPSLFNARGNPTKLAIRHEEYAAAFLNTYRSFCSPSVLIDMLCRRYSAAERDMLKHGDDEETAARIQLRIVRLCKGWAEKHPSDFVDDATLRQKAHGLLDLCCASAERIPIIREGGGRVVVSELRTLLLRRSLEPFGVYDGETVVDSAGSDPVTTSVYSNPRFSPLDVESYEPSLLLDVLDRAARDLFCRVAPECWRFVFGVVEIQSSDVLGWYPRQAGNESEETTEITNIYQLLEQVHRGREGSTERLVSTFPEPVRELFMFHDSMRAWVVSEVAGSPPDVVGRSQRMKNFIEMLRLARKRMSVYDPLPRGTSKRAANTLVDVLVENAIIKPGTCIPSLVERAISSGLCSPESRLFVRSWSETAQSLGAANVDTLEVLVESAERRGSVSSIEELDNTQGYPGPLTPCPGWIVERMIEECCLVPDMADDSDRSINFEKRRRVHDLFDMYADWRTEILTASLMRRKAQVREPPGPDVSFLTSHVKEGKPVFRALRELASRENSDGAATTKSSTGMISRDLNLSNRKISKPFNRLVAEQVEKNRRETKERDRSERELREAAFRVQKREMEQARQLERQLKDQQQRRAKDNQLLRMANLWSAVKPGHSDSSVLPSNNSPSSFEPGPHLLVRQISSASTTTTKPALTINLINSRSEIAYAYTKREFVFRIDTEEGGQYLFQAIDRSDMLDWIAACNAAAKDGAVKRSTVLVEDAERGERGVATSQSLEWSEANEASKGRSSVYGVDINILMMNGTVPIIVRKCIEEIEERGLNEVGIYRVPGTVSAINELRIAFNKDSYSVDLSLWEDINVVAGALKQFFREMPEPLTTFDMYDLFIQAIVIPDYDERLLSLKDLVHMLPPNNFVLLKRIVEHLERVTDFEDVNHMYATNLAIVFGPTLFRPPPGPTAFLSSMTNLGHQQNLVKNLILQYHWLFEVEEETEESKSYEDPSRGTEIEPLQETTGEEVEEEPSTEGREEEEPVTRGSEDGTRREVEDGTTP